MTNIYRNEINPDGNIRRKRGRVERWMEIFIIIVVILMESMLVNMDRNWINID